MRLRALTACVFWLLAWPLAAEITVSIDRDPVRVDESFTVTFEAEGRVDDKPDFSPLERDFELLGSTQSNTFSMRNTEITRLRSWTIRLLARRTGEIEIPAIKFGRDHSLPVTVRVVPAPGIQGERDGEIFVEVSADSTDPYVQSQVLVQVRLYRAVNTTGSSLSDPEASDGAAVVEPLDDRTYETWRSGRRFVVFERRYAVFPQRSGELIIEPVVFRGDVAERRRTVLIDPYGNPQYDTSGPASRTVVRRSPPLTLNVRPPAVAGDWLPSADVTLEESWSDDPPVFEVGRPVTRTITLTAARQSAAHLPDITLALPGEFRTYTDRVETDNVVDEHGITGRRIERYAMIAREPGQYTLPAVELQWFNLQAGRQETLTLAERTVDVRPAAVIDDPAPLAPAAAGPAATPATDGRIERLNYLWIGIILFLAMGWAATVWHVWRGRFRDKSGPAMAFDRDAGLRRLRLACVRNDAAAARAALQHWLQSEYGDDGRTLRQLVAGIDGDISAAVAELDQVLYGRGSGQWRGDRLLQAVDRLRRHRPASVEDDTGPLAPLYQNTD